MSDYTTQPVPHHDLGLKKPISRTSRFEQQMSKRIRNFSSCASPKRLPPEIVSLVFEELDYDLGTIQSCSLVCKLWRDTSFPFLFHHLRLLNAEAFLRVFRLLVFDSPHIGQYVRELVIGQSVFAPDSELERILPPATEPERLKALFLVLPRLKVLHCGFNGHLAIPLTLVRFSLTTLVLHGTIHPLQELLMLLQSAAETIRSLTIINMHLRGQYSVKGLLKRNLPSPGCMIALEELSIIECQYLPFFSSTIQMPNLKKLRLDALDGLEILACVPASLDTLVVQIEPSDALPTDRLLHVDNVVIVCHLIDAEEWVIQQTLNKLCVSSKIKQLEIILLPFDEYSLCDIAYMRGEDFEDNILSLQQDGSLERLIMTSPLCSDGVRAEFPKLARHGLLEVRSGTSSLLAPQRRRYKKTYDRWSWSSDL
ncbi:hypothetical protein EYR38_004978 [Pleurotus pulmonarius]|nr:hypothetical protein EYR38_004978 [Pleurotus pulmonarius]